MIPSIQFQSNNDLQPQHPPSNHQSVTTTAIEATQICNSNKTPTLQQPPCEPQELKTDKKKFTDLPIRQFS